jgi:hypothetical protein
MSSPGVWRVVLLLDADNVEDVQLAPSPVQIVPPGLIPKA